MNGMVGTTATAPTSSTRPLGAIGLIVVIGD